MTAYRVGDLAWTSGPTLSVDTPIRRAIALLVEARAAAAPVLDDDGGLVGILTQKDCLIPSLHAAYHREWTGRVADHMTPDVITVQSSDEVIRTAQMFIDHPHRVFPVLDGVRVVGLLHRSDVLALLIRNG